MNIENPLFLVPILTGPIVIIIMLVTLKFPPKKINSLYGYRTKRSMASQDAWDFAQPYSGKTMLRYMIIYTLTAAFAIPMGNIEPTTAVVLSLLTMILFMTIPIIKTEKELKARFENRA